MEDIKNDAEFQALVRFELEIWTDKMKNAARRAGLVATGEMVSAFEFEGVKMLEDGLEGKIKLLGYARFRDLTSMSYPRSPPVAAIRDWVEKKGVGNFAFVEGGKLENSFAAADKIAWAISKHYKQLPNIKRGYRGIYSRIVVNGMEDLIEKVLGVSGKWGINNLKKGFN